jgi:hypothetical protein
MGYGVLQYGSVSRQKMNEKEETRAAREARECLVSPFLGLLSLSHNLSVLANGHLARIQR